MKRVQRGGLKKDKAMTESLSKYFARVFTVVELRGVPRGQRKIDVEGSVSVLSEGRRCYRTDAQNKR